MPGGTYKAPWQVEREQQGQQDTPPPVVYTAEDGTAPYEELAHLAGRDPELLERLENTPVIAAFAHALPDGTPHDPVLGSLPGEFARNTGKSNWTSDGPVGLYFDPEKKVYTVAVFPERDGATAAPVTWRKTTPDEGDPPRPNLPPVSTRNSFVLPTNAPPATVPVQAAPVTAAAPASRRETAVPFPGGRVKLSADERAAVEEMARKFAVESESHWRLGVGPPRVKIVAFADGHPAAERDSSQSERIAELRARAVAAVFREELRGQLAALQRSLPPGRQALTLGDFSFSMSLDDGSPRAGRQRPTTIQVPSPSADRAVRRLDKLADHDVQRFGRPKPRPDDQVRKVLHLSSRTAVGDTERAALAVLMERAERNGRLTTFGQLAAFHLQQPTVLDRLGVTAADRTRRFTGDRGPVPGLNWTDRPVAKLDTSRLDTPGAGPAGSSVPWQGNPLVIAGQGLPGQVVMRLPNEAFWELSIEEAVEVAAREVAQAGLGTNDPVVLLVPFANRYNELLLRMIANRTGRTVWSYSGETPRVSSSGRIEVVHRKGQPVGTWVAVEPGLPLDENVPDWLWGADVRTVVSGKTGRRTGAMHFRSGELAHVRERFSRTLDQQKTFVYLNPATGALSAEHPLPVPPGMSEGDAIQDYGHGGPGITAMRRFDGSGFALAAEQRRAWNARLARLFRGKWLSVARCWHGTAPDVTRQAQNMAHAAPPPYVVDPLRDVSEGQATANETQMWVRSFERTHLVGELDDGRLVHAQYTDAQGRLPRVELFRPEPPVKTLEQWAREAGLHTGDGAVDPAVPSRTLLLLRALKLTFGRDVQDTDGFPDLLAGAAALEGMWRTDPRLSAAGPFTLGAFQRMVAAHPAGRSGVDQAGYRAVLDAAREAGDTTLTDFLPTVPTPALQAALAWLGRTGTAGGRPPRRRAPGSRVGGWSPGCSGRGSRRTNCWPAPAPANPPSCGGCCIWTRPSRSTTRGRRRPAGC
ncbi:lonely Cys domain-containing protein [Streptomyces sp. GKU 257-1]|nr:lonely Cys domain-containing protein [Streptomyces sp. GKU 257-1]